MMKGRNYMILTFKKQEFYFNVLMRDEKEERDGDEQIFITFLFYFNVYCARSWGLFLL